MKTITLGTVIDANDPDQMGRIRIFCPAWDKPEGSVGDLPWARYAAPFGGTLTGAPRGPEGEITGGPVGYGFWAIPKINSQVLVACESGDISKRYWLGCIFDPHIAHTMPHGRYNKEDGTGPLSSNESDIQPLRKNQKAAFNSDTSSEEWKSRAADFQLSRVRKEAIDNLILPTRIADDSTQGYAESRYEDKSLGSSRTDNKNYDSSIYSITTPGFHSLAMDDRKENCRIRLRTTGGHQILMDDTNERVYISTAKGDSWIELDQNGNIDVYSTGRISMHSKKEMNFTTDETFRVRAKKGIHLQSDDEIRLHSKANDIHIRSDQNIRLHSGAGSYWEADAELHIKSTANMNIETASTYDLLVGGAAKLESGATINIKAAAALSFSGSNASLNSGGIFYGSDFKTGGLGLVGHIHPLGTHHAIPHGSSLAGISGGGGISSAAAAAAAAAAEEKQAFFTARVPEHEPWARVMMDDSADQDSGNVHNPEIPYDDANVGKVERGVNITRNTNWRR